MPSPLPPALSSWLSSFVLRLRLCPFAHRPLVARPDELRHVAYEGSSLPPLVTLLKSEARLLASLDGSPSRLTTLVTLPPSLFPAFEDLNAFAAGALPLEIPELGGSVQVAQFHPGFRFSPAGGPGEDPAEDYVGRSPVPFLHLLREEEVGRAAGKWEGEGGAPIWERNGQVMRMIGEGGMGGVGGGGELPGEVLAFLEREKSGG